VILYWQILEKSVSRNDFFFKISKQQNDNRKEPTQMADQFDQSGIGWRWKLLKKMAAGLATKAQRECAGCWVPRPVLVELRY
jgi:hypothetical protein